MFAMPSPYIVMSMGDEISRRSYLIQNKTSTFGNVSIFFSSDYVLNVPNHQIYHNNNNILTSLYYAICRNHVIVSI